LSKSQTVIILFLAIIILTSGCSDSPGTNISVSSNDTEININIPETTNGSWCPAGSHIQVKNPATGEELGMTVAGNQEFEGKTLCKAIVKSGTEENLSKYEYMWSEDKNTTVWTKYSEDGNISVRYIFSNGTKTILDGSGRKLEFGEKT
jgi:hypothetical protein